MFLYIGAVGRLEMEEDWPVPEIVEIVIEELDLIILLEIYFLCLDKKQYCMYKDDNIHRRSSKTSLKSLKIQNPHQFLPFSLP